MHVICLLIISRKQTDKKLKLDRVVEEERERKDIYREEKTESKYV